MNLNLKDFEGYTHVAKAWGQEIWLTNTPSYCGKLLIIDQGMQCSMHMHRLKAETFIVLEGEVAIEEGGTPDEAAQRYRTIRPGDSVFLPNTTFHRFGAPDSPAVLLEISTHHDDEDVMRAIESGPCFPF